MTLALNNDCPHCTTIFRWVESDNFTLEDTERKERPRMSVTEANYCCEKMLDEDWRDTYKQIEETLHVHASEFI